jgi:hypothetical protein
VGRWRGLQRRQQAQRLQSVELFVAPDDVTDAIHGLGEIERPVMLGGWVGGEGKGDLAAGADECAEQGAGGAVGRGAGAVFEKGAEQGEDGGRDLFAGEGGEMDLDLTPGAEVGVAGPEGARAGLRCVVETEDVGVDGTAAAAFAVGKDVAAFHGWVLGRVRRSGVWRSALALFKGRLFGVRKNQTSWRSKEKARARRAFQSSTLSSGYQVEIEIVPNFLACKWCALKPSYFGEEVEGLTIFPGG